jgi:Tfp pilus assembly protein PilZ
MWEGATLVQGRGPSHARRIVEGGSATLNILRVRCQNAEEFREHYREDQPNGGLFCPTTTELSPGTQVVVEVICKALPNRVLIRGTVISWRPALPRLRVRAGAVVEFDAAETPKRDFILETLGGVRQPTPKRKHARIPLGWPAKMRVDSDLRAKEGELREISVIGALVHCQVQPPLETEVVLEVVPPGSMAPMELSGRVLYHAGPGLTGIKFIFREGGGSRRLRELVRRFKTS